MTPNNSKYQAHIVREDISGVFTISIWPLTPKIQIRNLMLFERGLKMSDERIFSITVL